jgi:hypothetical protein
MSWANLTVWGSAMQNLLKIKLGLIPWHFFKHGSHRTAHRARRVPQFCMLFSTHSDEIDEIWTLPWTWHFIIIIFLEIYKFALKKLRFFCQKYWRTKNVVGILWKHCFWGIFDLPSSNLSLVLSKKFEIPRYQIWCVCLSATVCIIHDAHDALCASEI